MTPSPFVVQWAPWVAANLTTGRRALDVAIGQGRHVEPLVRAGFKVFGVDRDWSAVRAAMASGAALGGPVLGWCAELQMGALPAARFDLVVVTRFLQRDLFPQLRETVKPGGFVLYETFTREQLRHGRRPTSPEHLLAGGELRAAFEPFDVISYEEVFEPDAVARLVAQRVA